jgi:hypothetical protein
VKRIPFHGIRHTHATLLLKEGVNVKVVSERLGHANIGITLDTYAHVLPSMQQLELRRFGEHPMICIRANRWRCPDTESSCPLSPAFKSDDTVSSLIPGQERLRRFLIPS